MKITIEAKEVNVRITDNDNEEVFTYTTANYSVFMNVTVFLTMAMGLIKHMMGLEKNMKAEVNVATTTTSELPVVDQPYFTISTSGIGRHIWVNDSVDLRNWQNGNVFLNFDTAAVKYKARHYA